MPYSKGTKLTILSAVDIQGIKNHNIHDRVCFVKRKYFFTCTDKNQMIVGVPIVAQKLTKPTRNHEVTGLIPSLPQWVKDQALP